MRFASIVSFDRSSDIRSPVPAPSLTAPRAVYLPIMTVK
jgi:hypothetical protein